MCKVISLTSLQRVGPTLSSMVTSIFQDTKFPLGSASAVARSRFTDLSVSKHLSLENPLHDTWTWTTIPCSNGWLDDWCSWTDSGSSHFNHPKSGWRMVAGFPWVPMTDPRLRSTSNARLRSGRSLCLDLSLTCQICRQSPPVTSVENTTYWIKTIRSCK